MSGMKGTNKNSNEQEDEELWTQEKFQSGNEGEDEEQFNKTRWH